MALIPSLSKAWQIYIPSGGNHAANALSSISKTWEAYSPSERRNIAMYIAGVILYKFGLEVFDGSMITMALDRFAPEHTFEKLGALTGINQAMQCIGAILIGPLVKTLSTKATLSGVVIVFGVSTTIPIIIDRTTGGHIKDLGELGPTYGTYSPDILFPIFMVSGVFHGMVDLIRRVIRRDIVDGDVRKLKQLDTLVHILGELAGTIGALSSTGLILRFGNNYSFLFTAPFFTLAGLFWLLIEIAEGKKSDVFVGNRMWYIRAVGDGTALLGKSIYSGAQMVFRRRKLVWLWACYSFGLYAHRYLETGIAPALAKQVFQVSAYMQILVGMSKLGVVFGIVSIFMSKIIKTALPWLRFGATLLLLIWIIPFYNATPDNMSFAARIAPLFMSLSFGWATGDLSLTLYIQSVLAREESLSGNVSAVGAVMSFLYTTFIFLYAVFPAVLGRIIDMVNIEMALIYVAGIQFSIISVFILINTFIPNGAFQLNPRSLTDSPRKSKPSINSRRYEVVPATVPQSERGIPQTPTVQSRLIGQYRYD